MTALICKIHNIYVRESFLLFKGLFLNENFNILITILTFYIKDKNATIY